MVLKALDALFLCLVFLFVTVDGAGRKLVLKDTFDTLDPVKWRHEVRLPGYPDYEFNYYNKTEENLYVKDGILYIRPTLTTDRYDENHLFRGTLELNRYPPQKALCTKAPDTGECHKIGQDGFRMLPPVVSGRIISNKRFRYGTVIIRAKMPLGDWIYPQIELIPVSKKYGKNSGTIIIAMTRGNLNLKLNNVDHRLDFGARWYEGGVVGSTYSPYKTNSMVAQFDPKGWYTEFHDYKLEWDADGMKWFIDGNLVGKRIIPPVKGFLPWANSRIAPFDEEMEIALGVGVGGIQRFPDGIVSNGFQKPWKNLSPKGMLQFWRAQRQWYPTWNTQESSLKIDTVEIRTTE